MTVIEKAPADDTTTNEDTINSTKTVTHNPTTIHAHLRDSAKAAGVATAVKCGDIIPQERTLAVYLDMDEVNNHQHLDTSPMQFCPHCLQEEYERQAAKRIEEERRKREDAERKARQNAYDQIARDITNGEAISESDLSFLLVDAKRRGEAGWEKFLNAMVSIDQKRLDDLGLEDWGVDLDDEDEVA
ncbi:hypothetical protein AY498_09510 [Corynebacterium ulcerans]|uniref:hypothetical protein n=1 Tax=Corynebacterium ulcerans TaxID=65058 RepID=UPI000C8028C1|nr:hypothetical protein [Corynebacterium ulcerans]PME08220.1 hypothetical protein AY498_09510 [Corynebacterium ulcerans]